jgi:hypothetical protein
MPDAPAIEQFARRLVELGCPTRSVRCCVQELSDHHQDLKNAALEGGMSEADAEDRADELLGEPVALAEHLAAVLRNSSWWGRHPWIGYCLLPPFTLITVVLLCLSLEALLGNLYFNADELRALTDTAPGIELARAAVAGTYYATVALTALLFCWLARRSSSGMKWVLAACAVCSLHSYFYKLGVSPHNFSMGYSFSSRVQELIAPAIPLVVAAAFMAWHWRTKRVLAPAFPGMAPAEQNPDGPSRARPIRLNSPKTGWLTPSSVIAAVFVAAIAWLIVTGVQHYQEQAAKRAHLRANVWPAERAAVMARIHSGQLPPAAFPGTTLDLHSHVNLRLRETFNHPENPNANNLTGFPEGIHTFGGVPFNISGRVQLRGHNLKEIDRAFPASARSIRVGLQASRIHLLHGACFVGPELRGTAVAKLVLHYADGSHQEMAIAAGDHLLDWWGPIYQTGVAKAEREPTAPGTDLAWVGTNPRLIQEQSGSSLRIYRSTFANPHPDREIVSIDYVSALTDAAPFLLGLTVE